MPVPVCACPSQPPLESAEGAGRTRHCRPPTAPNCTSSASRSMLLPAPRPRHCPNINSVPHNRNPLLLALCGPPTLFSPDLPAALAPSDFPTPAAYWMHFSAAVGGARSRPIGRGRAPGLPPVYLMLFPVISHVFCITPQATTQLLRWAGRQAEACRQPPAWLVLGNCWNVPMLCQVHGERPAAMPAAAAHCSTCCDGVVVAAWLCLCQRLHWHDCIVVPTKCAPSKEGTAG